MIARHRTVALGSLKALWMISVLLFLRVEIYETASVLNVSGIWPCVHAKCNRKFEIGELCECKIISIVLVHVVGWEEEASSLSWAASAGKTRFRCEWDQMRPRDCDSFHPKLPFYGQKICEWLPSSGLLIPTSLQSMRLPSRLAQCVRQFATVASDQPHIPQTVIEKVVQKYAVGLPHGKVVKAGDYVMIQPQHVMTHDNTGPVITKY